MEFAHLQRYELKDEEEIKGFIHKQRENVYQIHTYLPKIEFKMVTTVPHIKFNGSFLPLSQLAFSGLLKVLDPKMPFLFAINLPYELLEHNIMELKENNLDIVIFVKKEPHIVINIKALPFMTLKYEDLMEILGELFGEKRNYLRIDADDAHLLLSVQKEEKVEILPEDEYIPTVELFASEVGMKAPYARIGLLRTQCWNTALTQESLRWKSDFKRPYLYNKKDFLNKVKKVKESKIEEYIEKIRSSFKKILTDEDLIRIWRVLKIKFSPVYADKILKIPEEERKKYLTHVTERHRRSSRHYGEPPVKTKYTLFEIANRITAYARERENFYIRTYLEQLGGRLIFENDKI